MHGYACPLPGDEEFLIPPQTNILFHACKRIRAWDRRARRHFSQPGQRVAYFELGARHMGQPGIETIITGPIVAGTVREGYRFSIFPHSSKELARNYGFSIAIWNSKFNSLSRQVPGKSVHADSSPASGIPHIPRIFSSCHKHDPGIVGTARPRSLGDPVCPLTRPRI